jgi:hypothetical protein
MKRSWLMVAPLLASCFQPWTVDGLYRCGGGCPSDMTCDDGVCCRLGGVPMCPTLPLDSGMCPDGGTPQTYFADRDMDTFGNPAESRLACSKPLTESWVENSDDCDDTSAASHPGGMEVCDGRDNNCNGQIDEGQSPLQTYFRDLDGDGFGTNDAGNDTIMACACGSCVPPGYAGMAGDCAPNDPTRHPGATELCNGKDDDCNGQIDDNVTVGVGAACADAGLGECNAGTTACVGGAVVCRPTKMPSKDLCDGLDNNCNGTVDEQPDCGGPNQLLLNNAAVVAARDTGTLNLGGATPSTPTTCLKGMGTAETWTGPTGPWGGSGTDFHVWYAEAPGTSTWDLSRSGLKLHLQFTTAMTNQNTTTPWNTFAQPFVMVCNGNGKFSRYRPNLNGLPNDSLLQAAVMQVNTNMPFGASLPDAGWIIAAPGADLTQVKRIEVVIEPRDNTPKTPSFTITFNNSTGFKP